MTAPYPILLPLGERGRVREFEILNFEHWNLFAIWYLEFGAYHVMASTHLWQMA